MKKIYVDRPMKYFLLLSLNCSLFSFIHCSDDNSDQTKTDKPYDKTATKDKGSDKTNTEFTNMNADTIIYDGLIREYILYVPEAYDSLSPVPLMLNFHGNGGSARGHLSDTDMTEVADIENFILVYPQGSLLDGTSHWNPGLETPENKSNTDDFRFIEVLIQEITSSYVIDSTRIYACGYSNGAMFAYGLACYSSDKIAAIGSVSGSMLEETLNNCTPLHPMAMINIHGTSDFILPYEGLSGAYSSIEDILDYWTSFNHTTTDPLTNSITDNGTLIEYYAYQDGDSGTSVEHYKIVEGDHVWFDLSYEGANTSQLIWDFVSKYDLNGLK